MAEHQTTTASEAFGRDAFYAKRDERVSFEHPLGQIAAQRVAIVVPQSAIPSMGLELALWWSASIIRRMGRPFSEVVIVASDSFRACPSSLTAERDGSIEHVLTAELQGADPFARIEWRAPEADEPFLDTSRVLWLGQPPTVLPGASAIAINAHGWIAILQSGADEELVLTPSGIDFDAAPAAIVMAACMAAARIFTDTFESRSWPKHVSIALDSRSVSQDADECRSWLTAGRTRAGAAPWQGEQGPVPTLQKLLLVSAGGIGGNVAQIASQSYVRIGHARILDHDVFDLSNLNRAIGVGISAVGKPKVSMAAAALKQCCHGVAEAQTIYEHWRTPELLAEFRTPGTAVVVGVDQVRSRLEVASDWPWLMINGATSGTTLAAGIHSSAGGGCVGCWYGLDSASYTATRTPMACAAGVAPGAIEVGPVASYPFVSVAASAAVVSMLIHAAHDPGAWQETAGTVWSMSVRNPAAAQLRKLRITDRCLLLCSEQYLQPVLGRVATEVPS
jgi:hypothetical protein